MKAHYENGLYKQVEDTQALLDKMTARLDRIEQEHKEKIARLKEEHRQEVAELKAETEKRDKRIAELTVRNEALTQKDVQRMLSSGSCEHFCVFGQNPGENLCGHGITQISHGKVLKRQP